MSNRHVEVFYHDEQLYAMLEWLNEEPIIHFDIDKFNKSTYKLMETEARKIYKKLKDMGKKYIWAYVFYGIKHDVADFFIEKHKYVHVSSGQFTDLYRKEL